VKTFTTIWNNSSWFVSCYNSVFFLEVSRDSVNDFLRTIPWQVIEIQSNLRLRPRFLGMYKSPKQRNETSETKPPKRAKRAKRKQRNKRNERNYRDSFQIRIQNVSWIYKQLTSNREINSKWYGRWLGKETELPATLILLAFIWHLQIERGVVVISKGFQ